MPGARRPKPLKQGRTEKQVAGWVVEIPDYHPSKLNDLLGNQYKAARLKRLDREMIGLYCLYCRVPRATGKRRVGLTVVLGKGQRGADPDAYWKSTLDALVHVGMLIDDRKEYVELIRVAYERGERPGVRIRLEDVVREGGGP